MAESLHDRSRRKPSLVDTAGTPREASDVRAADRSARPAARPRPAAPPAPGMAIRLRRAWGRHPLVGFLGHRSRITFYRQLHALVKSGQGIPTSLAKLAAFAPDARTRQALEEMRRDIAAGATFAGSMRRHGDRFDDAIVELLLFAEETGALETVLAQVIRHQEEVQSLRWKTLFASLWPVYLLFAATFVGPLFGVARVAGRPGVSWGTTYLSGLGANLLLAGLAAAILLGGPFFVAALGLDATLERVVLALPFAGRVKRDFLASRFFLALGLGLGAGIEVKRSSRIALAASGSPALAAGTEEIVRRIEGGATLADALSPLEVFDRPSLGALAIGEDTGTLDEQLERLAADAQEAAMRGAKLLMLFALALVAAVVLASIVSDLLGTLFGPVSTYYNLPGSIR